RLRCTDSGANRGVAPLRSLTNALDLVEAEETLRKARRGRNADLRPADISVGAAMAAIAFGSPGKSIAAMAAPTRTSSELLIFGCRHEAVTTNRRHGVRSPSADRPSLS